MKRCFKCERSLPVTEFYAHPMMGDGRLGKCRDCTRKNVSVNYQKRESQYQAYERARAQQPERKAYLRDLENQPKGKQARARRQTRRRIRSPEKFRATSAVSNAIRDGRLSRGACRVCGESEAQGHHDDYTKPLDVRWLCPEHHREVHAQTEVRKP